MKRTGYGLLDLTPDQLFSLTLPELYDMANAKVYYMHRKSDTEMQRTAWQTALLMSATGNYGKKGIDPKKLYKPVFDESGKPIEDKEEKAVYVAIDKEVKETKLRELIQKFNK